MPRALTTIEKAAIVKALRLKPVAQWVAHDFGLASSTVTRLAHLNGVELISQSEHMKARRMTPEFVAVQRPAQRKAASAWLKERWQDPCYGKLLVKARRSTSVRRTAKKASSDLRVRRADV